MMTHQTGLDRVLIIGPSWIGDTVMAQSLFKRLKLENKNIVIDVLAPAWTLPLLSCMPEVNQTWSSPFQHGEFNLFGRSRLAKLLRSQQYQQAIILPNSWKSAWIPFYSHIPHRTGWLGEMRWGLINDIRYLDKTQLPRTVDRFVSLGLPPNTPLPKSIPYPKLVIRHQDVLKTCQSLNIDYCPRTPILALCPGAEYGPSKQWPAEHFATVANVMHKTGWQIWLFGSPNDTIIASHIQRHCSVKILNLVGRTSLAQAIDLLSLATTVVANDSGLMHIACALDKRTIAIYGSTLPDMAPPLSDKASSLFIPIDCRPCFKRICPLKHFNCLKQLTPKQVLEQLQHC